MFAHAEHKYVVLAHALHNYPVLAHAEHKYPVLAHALHKYPVLAHAKRMRRKIIDDYLLLYLNDLFGIKLIF